MAKEQRMKRAWIGCLGLWVVLAAWGIGMAASQSVSFAYRWMVTTALGLDALTPPWALVWEQSPIWFERWNPGGFSESPSRRLAEGPDALVTVMRRTLYGLDKQTGQTLWTQPLRGREIFDWTVVNGTFIYAAYDHDESTRQFSGVRAAIRLHDRTDSWVSTRPTRYLEKEWILVQGDCVVFNRFQEMDLAALSLRDGTPLWNVSQPTRPVYPIVASWFAYKGGLYVLAGHKDKGGLFLKRFDLATGQDSPLVHLFGNGAVSNQGAPPAVTTDGRLFIEYEEFRVDKSWLVAYDLEANRLLWQRQVLHGTELPRELRYARQIALPAHVGEPLVVTYDPNRVRLVDPTTGAILRDHALSGYTGWTEHNALLYNYPYLYTSARRRVGTGMAYDLFALNLTTGAVEWRQKIAQQDERFNTARAEILNFLVRDGTVLLSRTDGRLMAFRGAAPRRSGTP